MTIIDFEEAVRSYRQPKTAYRVRLDFRFSELICTRILVVDADTTLDDFHTMIQACGNWLNYHLYNFRLVHNGELMQSEPEWQIRDLEQFDYEPSKIASEKITLNEAFNELPSIQYSYDYGDGWEIMATCLESVWEPSKLVPYCESGKGDWPPDDVGGEGGFVRLLAILQDPSHNDYEHMEAWADSQGFEKYQLAKCNSRLMHWEDFRANVD